jgi:predicted HTH transcriptional regulator
MTSEELRAHIEAGQETPSRDYKGSSECNPRALARDILAMTNLRGGGTIIIGVEEKDGTFTPTGVLPEHDITYKYDELKDIVDSFADPYVRFSLERCQEALGLFIVIRVSDFEEHPVICKKSSPPKLNNKRELEQATIYIRTSQGRPASRKVQTSIEMRDIIELATDKAAQKLRARGFYPVEKSELKVEDSAAEKLNLEAKELLEIFGL